MERRGMLIVISGFSGAGKGSVVKELMKDDMLHLSVSATTRQPRPGEIHGREYFFISREEFEMMIQKDELLEYTQYVENYYGTPKKNVVSQLEKGFSVILEIETAGALQVKEKYPEAVLLFVTAPNVNALKGRLTSRGTENIDVVNKRLAKAADEADFINKYDFIVVNDNLQQCVNEVKAIIVALQLTPSNNVCLINKMKEELCEFAKGVK